MKIFANGKRSFSVFVEFDMIKLKEVKILVLILIGLSSSEKI